VYNTLEAAWAKYNRAARDLGVLHDNAKRFLKREPFRFEVELERDGWHVVRLHIREEPPPVLGVLVGSIAHQVYSALNHVTWALVVRNIGEAGALEPRIRNRIDFPVCKTVSEFRRREVLKHVGPVAAAKLEEVQPFHRLPSPSGAIHHPLLLMKELADADKHRVLPATYGSVDLAKTALVWDAGSTGPAYEPRLSEADRNLTDGTELGRIRFAHGNTTAKVQIEVPPTVDLVFESDTWAGLSLFSVGDCLATADRCISTLAPLVSADPWPPDDHDPMSPYRW
jgi:hypothetical protein